MNAAHAEDPAPGPFDRAAEADLIAAAKGGDADAYGRLVAACQRPLYAYALRLTADPHVAEDMCQDALLKGYRAIGGFSGGSALSTWLHRILHNTWLDHVRREARNTPLAGADDEDGEPPVLAREAVARFQDEVRGTELRARLEKALAAVAPIYREVVVLRDVQGHAYEEIAEITGIAVGTVKSRLARAREQLRALLSDEGAPTDAGSAVKSGDSKRGKGVTPAGTSGPPGASNEKRTRAPWT